MLLRLLPYVFLALGGAYVYHLYDSREDLRKVSAAQSVTIETQKTVIERERFAKMVALWAVRDREKELKELEEIDNEISKITGGKDVVGPRVGAFINRLR